MNKNNRSIYKAFLNIVKKQFNSHFTFSARCHPINLNVLWNHKKGASIGYIGSPKSAHKILLKLNTVQFVHLIGAPYRQKELPQGTLLVFLQWRMMISRFVSYPNFVLKSEEKNVGSPQNVKKYITMKNFKRNM